jgi:phthalate 4,5-dioxygenase
MLKRAENDLLTRVGPGTPMGSFLREYWIPAALSSELATPDGPPVRVMLLGEQLLAFRDSRGRVGLIANQCPHRGASLFFGRNEQAGLRCVYHGWKFDTRGVCVDMPNEPAESDFKHRVKAVGYPTRERGGIVWAYLGPRAEPPPLPDLEGNLHPAADKAVTAFQVDCNWLQMLEGDLDTSHVAFLHLGGVRAADQPAGTFSEYQLRERAAWFEVIDTPGGAAYGARRPSGAGLSYWRVAQWCFPFYSFTPPGVLGIKLGGNARVPMDDSHTLAFVMATTTPAPPRLEPNTSDWFGRFRSNARPENDFLIDRGVQHRNDGVAGYTGIDSFGMQDAAMTTSMGSILDRSREHLGTSDAMIIRLRRRLLAALDAYQRSGEVPTGVDDPRAYAVRSGGIVLPDDADWVSSTHDLRRAFVEQSHLDPAVAGPLS